MIREILGPDGLTAAVKLVAVFLLVVLVGAKLAHGGEQKPQRVVGHGLIKFNGLGPERWAQKYRQERALRRRLELRIERQGRARREAVVRRLQSARRLSLPAAFFELARAFECIHRGEGAWTSATGNGYFGGLQMDRGFMDSYAPVDLRAKGTADRWTPIEQVAVAIIGWSLRGSTFAPWPTTARWCGVL